jgi:hypothetical protein
MMNRTYLAAAATALFALLVLAAGCGTDAEGPVTRPFKESGWYSPEAGETVRYIDTLRSVSTISIPMGIGGSSTLKLGGTKGVVYKTILMQFEYDSLFDYEGMTVDSVILDLPVIIVQDTLFHVGVTFNELLEEFSESDTITSPPAFDPVPIPGANGETVRDMNVERTEFSIDRSIVQGWLDGSETPWPDGISISWASDPDTMGLIEMYSQNYGSNPPVLRVRFEGGEEVLLPSISDYSIISDEITSLAAAGGVARRLYFEFDLAGVPELATVHYSALVFHTDGSAGLGATYGEQLIGASTDFAYYIYTPDSTDISSPGILEGTGVSRSLIPPTIDAKIKIPLGRYMIDVLSGARVNTGLVLQSDLESSRVQILALYDSSAGDSLRPYIEIVYTMPTDFGGDE